MPDMIAQNLIKSAYRKGNIRNPSTQQYNDGLEDLQNMLASWSEDGLVIPYSKRENFTLTIGQNEYSIGVSADSPDLVSATGRPNKIRDAYIKISGYDYPIRTNMSEEEYNRIYDKTLQSRPYKLWYDPQYPNGIIKLNRSCDVAYDFWLVSEKPITEPLTLSTVLEVPGGMRKAIIYNLSVEVANDDDNKLPDHVERTAREALEKVFTNNYQERVDPAPERDPLLVRCNRQRYDMDFDIGE